MTSKSGSIGWFARLLALLVIASLVAGQPVSAFDDGGDDDYEVDDDYYEVDDDYYEVDDDDGYVPVVVEEAPVVVPEPVIPFEDDGYRRESATPQTVTILGADDDARRDGFLAGELVVRLRVGASIDELNARFGTIAVMETGPAPYYLLSVPTYLDLDDTEAAMRDDPGVEWVDRNYLSQAPEGRPWYFFISSERSPQLPTDVQPAEFDPVALRSCVGGAGVLVAVLDTGVDVDHPDLSGRIGGTPFNILDGTTDASDVGNQVDDDGDGLVDEVSGHGTHVAGIIARLAPESSILPVRVLNSDGVGDAFYVAAGIFYAVDQGADIINLSLSSTRDARVVREAVTYAHERGALVVAAAGNSNGTAPEYPAAYDTVLSVNAIDAQERRAGFSNYGETVDIAAPGVRIWSTAAGGGYSRWSGTSMATPFVSGAAALVASTEGEWWPNRLARRLLHTSVDLPDGRRGEANMTRLDVDRATGCG